MSHRTEKADSELLVYYIRQRGHSEADVRGFIGSLLLSMNLKQFYTLSVPQFAFSKR